MTRQKIEQLLVVFIDRLKEIWRDNLESAVLYGSFLTPDFNARSSNINLLVLVKGDLPDNLFNSRKIVQKFHHKIRLVPVFLPAELWRSSLDCFALEWHSIRNNYRVLCGHDTLKNLQVPKEALRLQVEREARENIIRFQQGLLFGLDLPALLFRSAGTLRVHLQNASEFMPAERLPKPASLPVIEIIKAGKLKYKRPQWAELARTHLAGLNEFALAVNRG